MSARSTSRGSGSGSRHWRSEEHTSELQSQSNLVCRLLLEKKKGHPDWTPLIPGNTRGVKSAPIYVCFDLTDSRVHPAELDPVQDPDLIPVGYCCSVQSLS